MGDQVELQRHWDTNLWSISIEIIDTQGHYIKYNVTGVTDHDFKVFDQEEKLELTKYPTQLALGEVLKSSPCLERREGSQLALGETPLTRFSKNELTMAQSELEE